MAKDGIRVHIVDDFSPFLEEFTRVSYIVGLEALSKAGSVIRDKARASMKRRTHDWHQRMANARRGSYKGLTVYQGSKNKVLGSRQSQKTGQTANPSSMANMITSNLMETKGTVVVGGMHRKLTPKRFNDGKVTGTAKTVNAVGKKTFAIIEKLNTGKRNSDHTWNGRDSMEGFKNAKYKARHFMQDGFIQARPIVHKYMTKMYEDQLHKSANKISVKPIRISS